ncbi:MAG: hypothetical protein RL113_1271 [Pseudomonadota bacterium]|jgi:hypothetical protein
MKKIENLMIESYGVDKLIVEEIHLYSIESVMGIRELRNFYMGEKK